MANLVEHTMLNGLEENLKSAIEMAGGEIPTDACVWDYPGIIRDQLSSEGSVIKILPGKGIQVERDAKGNYVVSVEYANNAGTIEINTIQAPSFAKGVEGGQWDKGTVLQSFLEDLFSKVLPYVPSVKGGEIIIADEEGNDVFGYDENTGKPLVTNGLDRYNQYIRLSLASQIEPVYISLENLKVDCDIDLLKYYTKEETNKLINASIEEAISDLKTQIQLNYYNKKDINNLVGKVEEEVEKISDELKEAKLNIASNYYTKGEIQDQIANVKIDMSDYYTKSDVNNLINNIEGTVEDIEDDFRRVEDSLMDTKSNLSSNYYTKTEIKDLISNVDVDMSEYYTKNETNALLNGIEKDITDVEKSVNSIESSINEVKTSVNDIKTSINDINASINTLNSNLLTNYYTKEEVESKVESIENAIDNVNDSVLSNTEKIAELSAEVEAVKSLETAGYEEGLILFDEIFCGKTNPVTISSKEELIKQLNKINNITLYSNIELGNTTLVVSSEVNINLNDKELVGGLFMENNGSILEGNSDSYVFMANPGSTVTISGQGQVKAQEATYSMAVWANGGTVIINDGKFSNAGDGCDLIYASNGGKVYIYGGEFVATGRSGEADGTKNEHSALNIKDAHRGICEIVVYGGKFYKFNPGDNVSETEHTSFLAPGYKSVQEGDWFKVVKE